MTGSQLPKELYTSIAHDISKIESQMECLIKDINILKTDIAIIKVGNNSDKILAVEAKAEMLQLEIHRIDMVMNSQKTISDINNNRWIRVIDSGYKIAVGVCVAYILYVMGIGAPIP